MGGVLWAEPLWGETFTGLRMGRFEKLVKAVRERGGNGPGGGRPWCLPLADRVLLVAVYYRTNLTMRQLAPLFGISPATVCRVIQRLRPLLAIKPAPRPVADVERLWIVDGTLVPVRDRTVAASSRIYRRCRPAGRLRPALPGPGTQPLWAVTQGISVEGRYARPRCSQSLPWWASRARWPVQSGARPDQAAAATEARRGSSRVVTSSSDSTDSAKTVASTPATRSSGIPWDAGSQAAVCSTPSGR
ncbi:hypothetical protein STAN_7133 [Streptomyces sp. CBMAI 2042]|nr:hypothetical protein STAN_7133 [Streptomyces sp. CBMAI 2042]